MIHTVTFENETYPLFQTTGNALRFIIPFAQEVCKGKGVDIGCNRPEWCFPGATPVDPNINPKFDAHNLPDTEYDYIIASHSLEHIDLWIYTLDYWFKCLRKGGVLFLYLPHPDQKYWRGWNNRKHIHVLTPEIIQWYLETKSSKVFVSGRDLNHSFCAMAEKTEINSDFCWC